MAAHTDTHLPFVAEVDGRVVGVAWLLVAERVPGGESLDRWYGDIQSVMAAKRSSPTASGATFPHMPRSVGLSLRRPPHDHVRAHGSYADTPPGRR
ncbi:hypothetical protein OHA72_45635 [Dactylosporangium sp. NBC_01737]|uniref:hypothetical protein n=1 Tax=Dactylosporangium sp. NBC_01737 TaxID=2975959 RepID=UPI002E12D35D|nr:hypothetical protein OHA72_45635 [Dactylosporangium sp. NBC_01737]